MSDLEGVMLSDYLLLQCISKGGIADVYRARQRGEGNYEVAVKIFRSSYAQRESFREYFMAEAEKIGQFDHPNILSVLEYGEGEGLLYIVTPFVLSGTLEDLLQRVGGKFSALQALPIIQQLCNAVQYAHNHDVIHGNIKPTNVFVAADGRLLLSDFGIAHSYDDSQQSLTRVGWGSAEYAAPEQSLGLVRRASDIYSLGVMLFRVLTGQPPFTGQTPVEVLLKHVRLQPPSARVLVPTISDAVDGVLAMAMQKRSDDRFASAEEFGDAFLAAVTVAPVASPVARPLATRKLQPIAGDSLVDGSVTSLPVPVPTSSQFSVAVDPQTPLPAHLAFTSQLAPSQAREESPALPPPLPPLPSPPALPVPSASPLSLPFMVEPASESVAEPQVNVVDTGDADGATDDTQIQQKSFLQEDDDAGSSLFWSVDPVEWSPLANNEESTVDVPFTASEYLNSNPPAPQPQTPMPVMPSVAISTSAPETLLMPDKEKDDRGNGTWNARFKKILPIIVVILLLLGLVGALLSSFLLPGDPGANSGQTTSTHGTSSGNGTGTGTAATATQPGALTATPNAKGTPSGAPTAIATHPVTTSTPVPAQPVVPPFFCTAGSITLDGSTNFQPAIQQLANDYSNQCSGGASFTVSADGDKAGLDAVGSGSVNLAYADLTSAGRAGLVDYQVGALMYAVVVNSDTQVTNVTTAQLQGIYTGKITNWSQLGGTDEPIQIVSRASGSAIRTLFETYVLKGVAQSVDGSVLFDDSNSVVAQRVLDTSGAISYIPLASVPLNGALAVSVNGVNPSSSAVSSNAYAFWSIEHLYSNQAAKGLALSFISFCSTSTGTNDFANAGIVPIKSVSQAALNAHTPGPTI